MKRTTASAFIFFFAAGAFGSEYGDGAAALSKQRYAEAAQHFSSWTTDHPDDFDAHALLGIARYHAGDRRGAVAALERARGGGSRTYGARALYYLGIAYSDLGEAGKAREAFATLHHSYPNSPEAAKIDRAVAVDRTQRPEPGRGEPMVGIASALSWFRFVAINDAGYNTNPSLAENPQSLPSEDPRGFLYDFASLRMDVPKTPLFLEGLVHNRDYFGDDSNDYRSLKGRMGADFDLTSNMRLTPRYSYSRSWFAHSYFETQHEGSVSLSSIAQKFEWAARPYFLDRRHDSAFAALDGAEEGVEARIGYRPGQFVKLVRLSATGDHRECDVNYLGYDEVEPSLRVRFGLPWRIDMDLISAYRWRSYAETSPVFGVRRDDKRLDGTIRLTRPIFPWLSVEASAEALDNTSNVSVHEYREEIYEAGIVIVL